MRILGLALLGFLVGLALIYGLWRLTVRRPLAVDWRAAAYMMAIASPVCVMLEVASGNLHAWLFGAELWRYQVLPVHGGATSLLNFGIWPLFGWHLYLFAEAEKQWRLGPRMLWGIRALKVMISGPVLELLANLGSLALFGRYFFYYLPDDLWHLTSVRVIPYYSASTLLLLGILKFLKNVRGKTWIGAASYAAGVAFITSSCS